MIGRPILGPNDYIVEQNGTTRIMLTQGHETIIDTVDYPRVGKLRWYLSKAAGKKYVTHSTPKSTGKAKTIYLHNLIMPGAATLEVDHINGDTLNNCHSNLRLVTHKQNAWNRKIESNNSSGRLGVYWNKRTNKWNSLIMRDGVAFSLGYFNCFKRALESRKLAEKKYFGCFARGSFI